MTGRIWIHIDGAAKGNPGPAAIGLIGRTRDGTPLFQHSSFIGETTNNVAEYTALIQGLRMARERGIQSVHVASDSQLVVRQIQGRYQVKKPHLKKLHDEALQLIQGFQLFEIVHIPREENTAADALANEAIKRHNASLP